MAEYYGRVDRDIRGGRLAPAEADAARSGRVGPRPSATAQSIPVRGWRHTERSVEFAPNRDVQGSGEISPRQQINCRCVNTKTKVARVI
jgi:hypothetical protein